MFAFVCLSLGRITREVCQRILMKFLSGEKSR